MSATSYVRYTLLDYTTFTLGLVLQLDLLGRLRLWLRGVGRAHLDLYPLGCDSLTEFAIFLTGLACRVEGRGLCGYSVRFTDFALLDFTQVRVGDAHLTP